MKSPNTIILVVAVSLLALGCIEYTVEEPQGDLEPDVKQVETQTMSDAPIKQIEDPIEDIELTFIGDDDEVEIGEMI